MLAHSAGVTECQPLNHEHSLYLPLRKTPEDTFRNTGKRPTQGRGVEYKTQSEIRAFCGPRTPYVRSHIYYESHNNCPRFSSRRPHFVLTLSSLRPHRGHFCNRFFTLLRFFPPVLFTFYPMKLHILCPVPQSLPHSCPAPLSLL